MNPFQGTVRHKLQQIIKLLSFKIHLSPIRDILYMFQQLSWIPGEILYIYIYIFLHSDM